MRCAKCQFENPNNTKFCGQCGAKLEMTCPFCGFTNPAQFRFCGECGQNLATQSRTRHLSPEEEGERKQITVLFSDLTGYTAMTEQLDPEEVKGITSRIFGKVAEVVDRYEGFIEKYAGDAVMALFGVPNAHEDDPLRAIRAAREIHRIVEALSPEVQKAIGRSISMHTGINTGLVVTGELNLEKGIHGVAGDTVNVAARLSGIAQPGEILVGQEVFRQTYGHFSFQSKGPVKVKGKSEPLLAYTVVRPGEPPQSLRGFSVVRAKLIGRKPEMMELTDAVTNLKKGKGRIFSIYGEAGAGKSRLVEEFKDQTDVHGVQWFKCHAYPYTQNIPYFPLKDLLNHLFGIEEEDIQKTIRKKIESGIDSLLEERSDIIPYVGSLYAIEYPETEEASPEFWKSRIQETMKTLLSELARKSPTVFLLEDLHWADPSFVELLRHTLLEVREPAIVLCVYRPTFSLFNSYQRRGLGKIYKEIQLQPLSPSEAQDMLTSLLMTDQIPSEVRQFVQEKAEGNPFYLEEMVNSLIESEIMIRDDESWKLTRPIKDSAISSTIQGIIAGRLDRLEKESKRVLQEASVIGRSFLYEILQRISKLQQDIDRCLRSLEQMDLIRTKTLHPDLEYIFKHALTQEVVYNGILISQRKDIHERIGLVMEKLFSDRLPECYEALAYHFSQGFSTLKAVEYLIKAGEKSYKRYSLEEAHQYFKEAYELLSGKEDRTKEEDVRIVDLLITWGCVHNCRADFKGFEELLLANEEIAKSAGDKERLGMFYAWMGWALRSREKLREAYDSLLRGLELGEEVASQRVIGYSCAWLSWTCADRGLLDEALTYGKRAQELIGQLHSDSEFVRFTLSGLGLTYYFRGDCKEAHGIGSELLKYAQRRSDLRCMTMGHTCIGFSHYVAGSYASAIQSFRNAIQVSADTLFSSAARLLLGMTYVMNGQFSEAESTLQEIMRESEDYGIEFLGTAAQLFYGVIQLSHGNLNKGLAIVEHVANVFLESGSMYRYATANYSLGQVYAKVVLRESEKSLSMIAKNIGFLLRSVPLAGKKAQAYFGKAIEVAKEIGAKGILGQTYLDLGRVYRAKKRNALAAESFSLAAETFRACNAKVYLEQAEEALALLK